MPIHANAYLVAFAMFIIFPLVWVASAEITSALDRRRRRLRREGWRAHRAYMDSLEPRRWTT